MKNLLSKVTVLLMFWALIFIAPMSSFASAPPRGPLLQRDFTLISYSNIPNVIETDANSDNPSISADGRYVVFESEATNLVPDDLNNIRDVFLYNVRTSTTTRISVDSEGGDANYSSYNPSISADGRYIVFGSDASNLVLNDTNDAEDIFLHDTQTGITTRVSVDSEGNEANGGSFAASISTDGRYIIFASYSTNLVDNDTNDAEDIFLHDTQTGTTTRVSVDSEGNEANTDSYKHTISPNGRYIIFDSSATNLVLDDTNDRSDVFLHDTQTGTTTRVSVDSEGNEGNENSTAGTVSNDGKVIFVSSASNLVDNDTNDDDDLFIHDSVTGLTQRLNINNGNGINRRVGGFNLSVDGRYLVFQTSAAIIPGDTNDVEDIFIYDFQTNTLERITQDDQGNEADNSSSRPSISADNRYIVFQSSARNLVDIDTGEISNIFLYDRFLSVPPTPPTPRRSSGGGMASPAMLAQLGITLNNQPSVSSTPCPTGALFNPTTGARCEGVVTPTTPPSFTFTRNLSLGMIGEDVRALQQFLNRNGFTIASSGPGSVGNETTRFGLLTRSALIRFQQANRITPAVGFFGPITRNVVNGR